MKAALSRCRPTGRPPLDPAGWMTSSPGRHWSGAGSSAATAEGGQGQVKNNRERLRESYRPERVRVLFVERPRLHRVRFSIEGIRGSTGRSRQHSRRPFPDSGAAISCPLFAASAATWWTCAGARWIVSGPGSAERHAGWVRRGSRKQYAGCARSRSSCCSVRSMRTAHGRRRLQRGAGCALWSPIPGDGCTGATSSGRSSYRRSAAGCGMKCSTGCNYVSVTDSLQTGYKHTWRIR